MPATRAAGIQTSNIIEGSRKRLRQTNDSGDDTSTAPSSSVVAGSIERRINSLTRDQVTQHGYTLLNALMEARDPNDGALLCEPFLKLPSKRQYPDYYEIIKRPLTLEDVRQRLDQNLYPSLPEVKHDCEIICMNAKRYNLKESEIWQLARELHSIIKLTYVAIVEALPEPSPSASRIPPASSDDASATAPPSASQNVKEEVRSSPRPKRITLRHSKSQAKMNEEAHQEAPVVHELQPPPPPTIQAPQPPPPPTIQAPLAPTQPLEDVKVEAQTPFAGPREDPGLQIQQSPQPEQVPVAEGEADAHGEEEEMDVDGAGDESQQIDHFRTESPVDTGNFGLTKQGLLDGRKRPGKRGKRLKATLRTMISTLRKVIGKQGHPITQYFDDLPSRAQYPDYYAAIHRPISLAMIERRVYDKDYINAHALFLDLEVMLDNAQYYNEEGSEVWNDAQEIRSYLESVAIPSLIADGFTLEKDDVRQSALPLHLAANSTIEAHKAAYRLLVAKSNGLDPDSEQQGMPSASPEPSGPKLRLGSGITQSPLTMQASGAPASFATSASNSASPTRSQTSAPLPSLPSTAMSPPIAPQPFPMSLPAATMPSPHGVGLPMDTAGSPPPPHPPREAMSPDAHLTTPSRMVRSTRSAKPSHYGPITPITEAKSRGRGKNGDASMMPSPQTSGAPSGMVHSPWSASSEYPSSFAPSAAASLPRNVPLPSQQSSQQQVTAPPPRPIPFEGEKRLPLISHFTVDVHVDSPNGRSMVCSPALRLRNELVKQHSVHLSPSTTHVMVQFPLRVLRQDSRAQIGAIREEASDGIAVSQADPRASLTEGAPAGRQVGSDEDDENEGQDPGSSTWPWWPQLTFNGREVSGSWSSVAGHANLGSGLKAGGRGDKNAVDGQPSDVAARKVGTALCHARLLPKKGLNVFQVKVSVDESCEALLGLSSEDYRVYFSC